MDDFIMDEYAFEEIVAMVFDLLNEYDIGIWEQIRYIDLADFWCDQVIDKKIYDNEKLKNNLRCFLLSGGYC